MSDSQDDLPIGLTGDKRAPYWQTAAFANWSKGDRNNSLFRCLMVAWERYDVVWEKAYEPILTEARRAGLSETEIKATVKSVHSYKDKKNAKSAQVEAKIPRDNQLGKMDGYGLRTALDVLGIRYRYNSRNASCQLRGNDTDWIDMYAPEGLVASQSISDMIGRRFYAGKSLVNLSRTKFFELMEGIAPSLPCDPVVDYLKRCAERTHTNSMCEFALEDLLGVADTPLNRLVSKNIFLGIVQRAFEPGCTIDETPILLGAPGIGKTTFLRNLLPDAAWYTSSVSYNMDYKQLAEATAGKALVEYGELDGLRKADIARLKNILTSAQITARLAYARAATTVPVRWYSVGTANYDAEMPNDKALRRRFIMVECRKGNAEYIREMLEEYRDDCFSEAVIRYYKGERCILPRELVKEASQSTSSMVSGDPVVDDAALKIREELGNDGFISSLHANDRLHRAVHYSSGAPTPAISRADTLRYGTALKRCGLRRTTARIDGKVLRGYRKIPTL